MSLAVFGGSFNPPHVAHAMVVLYVLETQPVDGVIVVPSYKHPFDKQNVAFADRLEMTRLAMAGLGPRVTVSPIEEELGLSRTLDTLTALAARTPGVALRLIVGADILGDRDKWYRWPDVERLAPPIIVGRQGYEGPTDVVQLPAISSTAIRSTVAAGGSIEPWCARPVVEYIRAKGLYR